MGKLILAVILVFVSQSSFALTPDLLSQIRNGPSQEGCYTRAIVFNEERCRKMQEVIISAKLLYTQDDKKFIETMTKAIGEITDSTTYNYLTVLIANLAKDKRLIPAMKNLAAIEEQKQIKFRYATNSLKILSEGKCEENIIPEYREICEYTDQEFMRIRMRKE